MSSDLNKRLERILELQKENRGEIDEVRAAVSALEAKVAPDPAAGLHAPRRSVSRDALERLGLLFKGFVDVARGKTDLERVYGDALGMDVEQRAAINSSSDTGGVFLIPSPLLAEVLQVAGAEGAYRRAKPRIIGTDSASISIPVLASDVSVAMTAELANSTESEPTFTSAVVSLKKATAWAKASNEVVADSAVAVGAFLAAQFARKIEAQIDHQAFNTTGAGNDFIGAAGAVTTTYSGSGLANLDVFAKALHLLPLGAQANASWVMHPAAWSNIAYKLKYVEDTVNSSASNRPLADAGIFTAAPLTFLGKPVVLCDSLTVASTASTVYVGDFSQGAVLGERNGEGYQVLVDPYSDAVAGAVRFHVWQRFAIKYPLVTCFAKVLTVPHVNA